MFCRISSARFRIVFFDLFDDLLGRRTVDHVQNLGKLRDAAGLLGRGCLLLRQDLFENLVNLLQHSRGDLVQIGDAGRHIGTHLVRQARHHFAGHMGLEVSDHQGNRLRMFVLDQLDQGIRRQRLDGLQVFGLLFVHGIVAAALPPAFFRPLQLFRRRCLFEKLPGHAFDQRRGEVLQSGLQFENQISLGFAELIDHRADHVPAQCMHENGGF
jgi:hypothetical protein